MEQLIDINMRLSKFKVRNFRSVEDSGWINCDDSTTLVGINESGKSNLLMALWKMNPVTGGEIDPLHDMPASKITELRSKLPETSFVEGEFLLDEKEEQKLKEICSGKIKINDVSRVNVQKFYDGKLKVILPEELRGEIAVAEQENQDEASSNAALDKEINDYIVSILPHFVYYSNYGNLSSRIYLPHVIEWLEGRSVPGIAKSEEEIRTIRILFHFIGINPKEIHELGHIPTNPGQANGLPKEAITKYKNKAEERSLLLKSASTILTKQFKDWWQQGSYNFKLDIDGNYFSICVSDDKRPEEVDLNSRSTGLKWFLSFFLVFLVESEMAHNNAILLLDEAGLTLHPNAQKDLRRFFNELAKHNQLLLSTHSPFIIDTDCIDTCRVVYSDANGRTVCSNDLKASARSEAKDSIYAIYSALGINSCDILFYGCQPVIVEGPSDQFYLTAIKNVLIQEHLIAPKRELVFIPSGGVKGISSVASILSGKSDNLPYIIIDSDKHGKAYVNKLVSDLYQDCKHKIIQMHDIVGFDGAEVEDLIDHKILDSIVQPYTRGASDIFSSERDKPFLLQFESYADVNGILLPKGYKVEIARYFKQLSIQDTFAPSKDLLDVWCKLFRIITNEE